MTHITILRAAVLLWLCSLLGAAAAGEEAAARQRLLSLSDLEQKTLEELGQEKARLTRLLSDRDPFAAVDPGALESRMALVARAWLMGDIVRMQYLVRVLSIQGVEAAKPESLPPEFELATDPLRLTVVQRRSKPIPGFHGAISVRIGDITFGQVLLDILSDDVLRPVVDTVSVRKGDVIPFELAGVKYCLLVVELRNFLIGDDFAVLDISTKAPPPKPETPPEQKGPAERDQTQEIEKLLKWIESSDVVFIRNGNEANAAGAAAHLRMKWHSVAPPITTMHEFIEEIASRSWVTGRPYQVKLADGSVIEAATWLRQQLDNASAETTP